MNEPCSENDYLSEHAALLISSYHRLTGKELIVRKTPDQNMYRALYTAPYGVVSHGTEEDPVFNYGNRAALDVFRMSWEEFTTLPSRKSAEPLNRKERQQLLDRVRKNGFIDDYCGVRISSIGTRFRIQEATVWNLVNDGGAHCGQAAVFYRWQELEA